MDSQTYKEYIETHPPRCIAPNHYKGDMVFANFGYVNIEGKWVDPESEGELYRAYMNPTEGPNSKIPLPTLRQRLDSGPRIMAPEEQLKFYNEYVMNVTDWVDAEGDPRMLRISPATFLRWAAGAVKGEHFEETPLAAQEFPAEGFLDGTEDEDNLFKIDHKVQFDLDSRSILSGMYTPDPNPRPHKNPHGHTNIIRAPATFAYSYPQAALDLEKAVFGSGSNDSTTAYSPVSMASTPETFTSVSTVSNS
ncbi:hypothetical protein BGZ60DRAFT_12180 [Tricladium varicosporioides]|nr:hypothetical protein BGZ60DRAFT_12180 [Hymenoscyphus varicosporioides]